LPFNSIVDPADSIGLHRLQIDHDFPLETMAGSGRYLTFQVLNPTPKVRMLVAGTTTRLPGDRDLPPAAVVGDQRVSLPFAGRGAARVISEPVSLQQIGAANFLVLDLGLAPSAFDAEKSPWGSDPRPITMFIRDVSLLCEEDYIALLPPACVKNFPADLGNKHLEFSGCEEDGSVGKLSWFKLSRSRTAGTVVVRGEIPVTDLGSRGQNQLVVKWNGVEVGRNTFSRGQFEFHGSLPAGDGPGKLELQFSNSWSLSTSIHPGGGASTHQISAVISFVGIER
jgi:hypothetical protein